eukprot:gene32166-40691_t
MVVITFRVLTIIIRLRQVFHMGRMFVARESGRWKATPLLVVLLAIELTDVVFSWDNVAAVFGCSTNMTVIWTATMFAIITLRSWFSIISQFSEKPSTLEPVSRYLKIDGSPDEASSAVNNTNSKSARTTTAYSTSKLQTKSWVTIVLVTAAAALTGCWIYWKFGFDLASQFFSVYLVEQSLSADNVLVMYLIFEKFRVPEQHRPRVLFWGVLTAAVLRVAMISVGALGMLNFRWMNLLFAAVILHSGFSMLAPGDEEDDDDMESSSIITSVQRWLPVTAEYHGG